MIGRRAVVGLSLLCALLFCAFAVQSASAAPATNTTAVTCVKVEKAKTGDFEDAHCDKASATKVGEFTHVSFAGSTEVEVTNEKTASETKASTPAIQKGTIAGVKTEITCNTVGGSGTLTNAEKEGKSNVTGTIKAEFNTCTVNKPAGFGCKVKQPIVVSSIVEGVEGLGAGKDEMGLEFKPEAGKPFAQLVIEGCIFKGTFNVEGTAIGTGTPSPKEKFSGATNIFTNAMTKETLNSPVMPPKSQARPQLA